MSERLSTAGYKRLYALSGNHCAFDGCNNPVTVEENGVAVTTSEAAHIVGKSRQGPRGRSPIGDDERRSVMNHVLFCDFHHKLVDHNLRIYSTGVLQKMKFDHEAREAGRPPSAPYTDCIEESVALTGLPVVGLPSSVYVAKALKQDFTATLGMMRPLKRRDGRKELTPFVQNFDNRVCAFHDLSQRHGPFAQAVRRDSTERLDALEMWSNDDGRRQYVRLLNQLFSLHLRDRGLAWDKAHKRYWFAAADGQERFVVVPTKTGANRKRLVAYEQKYRSGDTKGVWCHWALEWSFEQVGRQNWILATRPVSQWTTDGKALLDPDRVGRKAAKRMAHIYNAQYFDQVHFWHEWLTQSQPRLVVPAGHASLVVAGERPNTNVSWPEIGDTTFDPVGPAEENLLTILDYQTALEIDPEELYVEEPDPDAEAGAA